MNAQYSHALLPQTTHDELSRQNFVKTLKRHFVQTLSVNLQQRYENQVKLQFIEKYQHPPQNHHEIRAAMAEEADYRWFSALKRTIQEMMWESVQISIERQLPQLQAQLSNNSHFLGSLTLDSSLAIPAYQKAVDIHCMPGNYYTENNDQDIAAGALYDRGVYLYAMGMLGPLNDNLGHSAIYNFLKPHYPNFSPRKILDLGCSVGHSTLPYVDAYPDAEVWAIDVAAPMLRYGHARAEALGKKVHFSQQNAEKTNFLDNSFDLIVSHILLHEIPVPAIRNVLKECYRLLAPGGIMVHLEGAIYKDLDPYRAFIYDWETANNNEPFWSAMRDLDLNATAIEAGFKPNNIQQTYVANGVQPASSNGKRNEFGSRGTWLILAASHS